MEVTLAARATWQCTACTLENPTEKRRCQACQTRRSVASISSNLTENTTMPSSVSTIKSTRKRQRCDQEESENISFPRKNRIQNLDDNDTKELPVKSARARRVTDEWNGPINFQCPLPLPSSNLNTIQSVDAPNKVPVTPTSISFRKASSNESIKVTESGLEKARLLWNNENKAPAGQRVNVSRPQQVSFPAKSQPESHRSSAATISASFQKAGSNQIIQVENSSLEKANKILGVKSNERITSHEDFVPTFDQSKSDGFSKWYSQEQRNAQAVRVSISFQKAGSKERITVEDLSMDKAKRLLDGANITPQQQQQQHLEGSTKPRATTATSIPVVSFQKAGSNERITVEDSSMDKAKRLLDGANITPQQQQQHLERSTKPRATTATSIPAVSFQKAGSNERITVEDSSMDKAKRLLDGANNTPQQQQQHLERSTKPRATTATSIPAVSFQKAGSNERITVEDSSIDKAKRMLSRTNNETSTHEVSRHKQSMRTSSELITSAFFQADGSNKAIKVLDSSLKRAKQLMGEGKRERIVSNIQMPEKPRATTFTAAFKKAGSNNTVMVTKESLERANTILEMRKSEAKRFVATPLSRQFDEIEMPFDVLPSKLQDNTGVTFRKAGSSEIIEVTESDLEKAKVVFGKGRHGAMSNQNNDSLTTETDGVGDRMQNSSFAVNATSQVMPVTPLPSISTPRNQPLRWDLLRQIKNGVTPSSALSTNPHTTRSSALSQMSRGHVFKGLNPNPMARSETDDRHQVKRTQDPESNVALSTSPDYRAKLMSQHAMTPVPIDLSNDKTRSQESLQDCTVDSCDDDKPGIGMNLEDAMKEGKMIKDVDFCMGNGVSEITMTIDSKNGKDLYFDAKNHMPLGFNICEGPHPVLGFTEDLREALAVDSNKVKNISDKWIGNHKQLVIWKLASYERSFSPFLGGHYLNYTNLIRNLKKRFEIEFLKGLRPAVRKILNRDVAASRLIILVVSDIVPIGHIRSGEEDLSNFKVELTDGWYCIQATIDDKLATFIKDGLIKVGSKLLISNAQLHGAEEGIDPLDENYLPFSQDCDVRLKINVNSTRLAKWNAKLGFVKYNSSFAPRGLLLVKKLSDILPGGGEIPMVRFLVSRRYPLLYLEKSNETTSGSKSKAPILSEVEEAARQQEFEKHVLRAIERLRDKMEKDLEKEVDEGAPDIWKDIVNNPSPEDAYEHLCEEDQLIVTDWKQKRLILLQKRVQEEVNAEMETDPSLVRESIPFIRLKVGTVGSSSSTKVEEAMLTIWHPTEDQLDVIQEGHTLQAQHVGVRKTRFDGLLQLTGNSRTVLEKYEPLESHVPLPLDISQRRFLTLFDIHLLSLEALEGDDFAIAPIKDIDTVAAQLKIVPARDGDKGFSIYLSDESNLLLRIECDCSIFKVLAQKQDPHEDKFPVFAFCDLRLLMFDFDKNCAVAKFCENSSITRTTPRLVELRNYVSSSTHNDWFCLSRSLLYLDAKLPMWHSTDNFTAIGYVVGLKSVSSKNLHIEVDCGTSQIEEWELPIPLLEEVLPAIPSLQKVALLPKEEQRLLVFGVLGEFFRAKGILWHFRLKTNGANSLGPSICKFVVTKIKIADPYQTGMLFSRASTSVLQIS